MTYNNVSLDMSELSHSPAPEASRLPVIQQLQAKLAAASCVKQRPQWEQCPRWIQARTRIQSPQLLQSEIMNHTCHYLQTRQIVYHQTAQSLPNQDSVHGPNLLPNSSKASIVRLKATDGSQPTLGLEVLKLTKQVD